MRVTETEEGFDIEWDPEDPLECVFNDWTEEDFTAAIMLSVKKVLGEHSFEEEFMEK